MYYKGLVAAVAAASILAGCAKKSEDIAAQYVSPMQYQSYSCRQIAEEAQRVTNQAAQLSGAQDKSKRCLSGTLSAPAWTAR